MIEFLVAATLIVNGERLHASQDDCQIIAAIGRSELGWGAAPPEPHFQAEHVTADGDVYIQDCDWRALNLAPPILGTSRSRWTFSIFQPSYDPDGRRATVPFSQGTGPAQNSSQVCTLERKDGDWRLLHCQHSVIS